MAAVRRILLSVPRADDLPGFGAAVSADPLTPRSVLRVAFAARDFVGLPPELGTIDVFEFALGLDPVRPIGSFTTRLVDRGRLLGNYTGDEPGRGGGIAFSRFKAASSIYSVALRRRLLDINSSR